MIAGKGICGWWRGWNDKKEPCTQKTEGIGTAWKSAGWGQSSGGLTDPGAFLSMAIWDIVLFHSHVPLSMVCPLHNYCCRAALCRCTQRARSLGTKSSQGTLNQWGQAGCGKVSIPRNRRDYFEGWSSPSREQSLLDFSARWDLAWYPPFPSSLISSHFTHFFPGIFLVNSVSPNPHLKVSFRGINPDICYCY